METGRYRPGRFAVIHQRYGGGFIAGEVAVPVRVVTTF